MRQKPETANSPVFFSRQFDRRVWISAAVVLGSLLAGAALTLHAAWPDRIRVGYKPDQPIAFSHQLHAGVMEIRCRYCHVGVDSGPHASVPPLSVCMNCHANFEGDENEPEQIEKIRVLLEYWENGKPVLWNKVYDLEDFAYFDHSRHMGAGLDCVNCHGRVETMAVIEQATPLTMGWCLKCHMGRRDFLLEPDAALAGKTGAQIVKDPVYREILAPIHCSTCHR